MISAPAGKLSGVWRDRDVAAFLGIRYAEPPAGPRRWRPPVPAVRWDGVFEAIDFGPAAPQPVGADGGFRDRIHRAFGRRPTPVPAARIDEDCLFLNVYTPEPSSAGRLPVMVWFHGGAFMSGRAADYDGSSLARRGVVVVTMNYRLGALGFLAHPALTGESEHGSSGNYGLMDQAEALRWVQRNITAFGGDPGCVTIFGESAGALSVGHHMVSPLSRGLFHRAISQSGVGLNVLAKLREDVGGQPSPEAAGRAFAERLGARDAGALRSLPTSALVDAQGVDVTQPIVDGHVIHERLLSSFRSGRAADVPYLLGANSHEGEALYWGTPLVEIPPPVLTVEAYAAGIRRVFGPRADGLLAKYPAATPEQMVASSKRLLGDSLFGAQAHYVASRFAQQDRAAYLYRFSRTPDGPSAEALGAFHGAELSFVFGADVLWPLRDEDRALSATMIDYWTAFAAKGQPRARGRPAWRRFDPARNEVMELGAHIGMARLAKDYTELEAYLDARPD